MVIDDVCVIGRRVSLCLATGKMRTYGHVDLRTVSG